MAEIRPGDSMLEHLELLRIGAYPATNLPADLAPLMTKPFKTRLARIDPKSWVPGSMPADLEQSIGRSRLRFFQTQPAIAPSPGAGRPRILVGLREVPGRLAASARSTGPFLWWDDASKSLQCVAESPPESVTVDYVADPAGELGAYEMPIRDSAKEQFRLAPMDLLRRVERKYVTRSALLLPAGGMLSLSIGKLAADEVRVAVALEDAGWRKVGDRVDRAPKRTDGALVAVDAVVDGRRQRLWSQKLEADQAAAGFVEARVSLKAVAGKSVELRLVTEPGPAGDPAFDYVLWGDLTFQGEHAPPSRPHVVLIDIDTLRADSLSIYGAKNATSPHFDLWAQRRATVYRDAEVTCSWTLPSTTSILTGTYVQQHGVENAASTTIGAVPMLQSILKGSGYETWGMSEAGYVLPTFGFGDGFDRYESRFGQKMEWEKAVEFLGSRRSARPIFLFMHTYLVHAPYDSDMRFDHRCEPYQGPLQGQTVDYGNVIDPVNGGMLQLSQRETLYVKNLYEAGVARMDERLARFLIALERAFRDEDWMLVFTSDHGEEFLEHSLLAHGFSLHREVMNVPLVIRWPKSVASAPAIGFNDAAVSSVDIVPTVLECVRLEPSDRLPGRSLLSLEPDSDRPRLGFLKPDHQSITFEEHRLIRKGNADGFTFALFDLRSDPFEKNDIAAAQPDRVRRMNETLEQFSKRYPRVEGGTGADASLSAEALAGLRALGYIK